MTMVIKRNTFSQEAYEKIIERIVNFELPSGVRLKEEHIARELGVSATPVREAFRRLEKEQWIENIPHIGSRVREITVTEVKELYEIREALEGMAARLGTQLMTDNELLQLEEIVKKMAELIKVDEMAHSEQDMEFHRLLVAGSRNGRLIQIVTVCNLQARTLRMAKNIRLSYSDRELYVVKEHEAIVEGFKKRDGDIAEKAVREHIRNAKERVLRVVKSRLDSKLEENPFC